jgi:hypothetical protein
VVEAQLCLLLRELVNKLLRVCGEVSDVTTLMGETRKEMMSLLGGVGANGILVGEQEILRQGEVGHAPRKRLANGQLNGQYWCHHLIRIETRMMGDGGGAAAKEWLTGLLRAWEYAFTSASAHASNMLRNSHYLTAQFLLKRSRKRTVVLGNGERGVRGGNVPWLIMPRTGFGGWVERRVGGLRPATKRALAGIAPGKLVDRVWHVARRIGARFSMPKEHGTTCKCPICGVHVVLTLMDRVFVCWLCGFSHERDCKGADCVLVRKFAVEVLCGESGKQHTPFQRNGVRLADARPRDEDEEDDDEEDGAFLEEDDGGEDDGSEMSNMEENVDEGGKLVGNDDDNDDDGDFSRKSTGTKKKAKVEKASVVLESDDVEDEATTTTTKTVTRKRGRKTE